MDRNRTRWAASVLALFVGAADALPSDEPAGAPRTNAALDAGFAAAWAGRRISDLQMIGTHNSYKRALQPELKKHFEDTFGVDLQGIDYAHLPLADQLNLGIRALELDVYFDPDGGRFTPPAAHALLRAAGIEPDPWDEAGEAMTPGFKVIHDLDADFRTHHVAFEGALHALRTWSETNPGHLPVFVTMNAKSGERRIPLARTGGDFTPEVIADLEDTILRGLGRERLLTPDDVRGSHESLREAIESRGWPLVGQCAGRFVFVFDHGGGLRESLRHARPEARGGVFFPTAEDGDDDAAFFILNEPARDEASIRDLVARGYMVRTRADAGTEEARREDWSRFEGALRSGAQIISTDYPIVDRSISETYVVRFEGGAFVRARPAGIGAHE